MFRKVYELLSGRRRGIDMFSPAAGLLLRSDLHHSFDRQEWSLFHKVGGVSQPPSVFFGSGWLTVIERLIMSHHPSQLVIILMLFCRMAFSTFTFSFSAVRGCLAKLPFNTMAQRSLPVGFAQTIRTFPTSLLSTGTISSV
jgi:hypothetical protein